MCSAAGMFSPAMMVRLLMCGFELKVNSCRALSYSDVSSFTWPASGAAPRWWCIDVEMMMVLE
jgi:hypothetical protein